MARHGQDEDNVNGILNGQRDQALTIQGIAQAESIANKILESGIRFDKIYSSPLKRALKTANIISRKLDGPRPIVYNELIERNFGIMTGEPLSEIVNMCSPDIFYSKDINYFLCPEGAETFPQLIKRGHGVIRKMQEEGDDKNILLVTHGDIGKMVYSAFYDLDWKDTLSQFFFGNADLLLLSEDSPSEDAHVFKTTIKEGK